MAETVLLMGSGAAGRHVANLAGLEASPASLRHWSLRPGAAAQRSGREEVVDARPLEPRMYLSIDGTGVPMRREEVAGVAGRQEDGAPETGEARLAVVYTAGGGGGGGRDPGTGVAGSFSRLTADAAAGVARRGRTGRRLRRGGVDTEHLRRALRGAEGHLRARHVAFP